MTIPGVGHQKKRPVGCDAVASPGAGIILRDLAGPGEQTTRRQR